MPKTYDVRPVNSSNHDTLVQLIRTTNYAPARMMQRYAGRNAIEEHLIKKYENSTIYGVFESDKLIATTILSPLQWDSEIYNQKMGSLEHTIYHGHVADKTTLVDALTTLVKHVELLARKQSYDFLLCKTFTDDIQLIHALQRSEFYLVDTLLDYVYHNQYRPLDEINEPSSHLPIVIRDANQADRSDLVQLAEITFESHFGRYHSDNRTDKELATSVYVEWIKSSLDGYGDRILVADLDGEIVGYTVWRHPLNETNILGRIGQYSIAGIHPDSSGANLFRVLTYAGMQALAPLTDFIVGPTHINNYPVQRGYESLGWRIHDARHAFHKWLD
ncbi:MAG: hypothetical protein AAFV93_19415 [Chloroflexota bacterium]